MRYPFPPADSLFAETPVAEQPKLAVSSALRVELLDAREWGACHSLERIQNFLIQSLYILSPNQFCGGLVKALNGFLFSRKALLSLEKGGGDGFERSVIHLAGMSDFWFHTQVNMTKIPERTLPGQRFPAHSGLGREPAGIGTVRAGALGALRLRPEVIEDGSAKNQRLIGGIFRVGVEIHPDTRLPIFPMNDLVDRCPRTIPVDVDLSSTDRLHRKTHQADAQQKKSARFRGGGNSSGAAETGAAEIAGASR